MARATSSFNDRMKWRSSRGARTSINGNSVVPGLPKMYSTPSWWSSSASAYFPDISAMLSPLEPQTDPDAHRWFFVISVYLSPSVVNRFFLCLAELLAHDFRPGHHGLQLLHAHATGAPAEPTV